MRELTKDCSSGILQHHPCALLEWAMGRYNTADAKEGACMTMAEEATATTLPPVLRIQVDAISKATTYQTRHRGGKDGLDQNHVDTLTSALTEDAAEDLEPLWIARQKNELVIMAGFHRRAAYVAAGRTVIPVRIWAEISHQDAFALAAQSNSLDQLIWSLPERKLTIRAMIADPIMARWGFDRIAKIVRVRRDVVREEWMIANPGQSEREVLGADDVVYKVKIGAGSRTGMGNGGVIHADADDDAEGFMYDGTEDASGIEQPRSAPIASMTSIGAPAANGVGRLRAPQSMPSMGGGVPGAMGVAGTVMLRAPRAPHPTQALSYLNLSWELASGEEKQITTDGSSDPTPLPAAVRIELIRWLEAQS